MPRDRPPGIWETLKRALGGVGAEPRAEPRPAPAARPAPSELPAVPPERELASAPPFIAEFEGPESPQSHAAMEPPRSAAPPDSSAPVEPASAPEGPRLARGLASFSRSNADREKKFAHLLHDDAPGRKKKPRS